MFPSTSNNVQYSRRLLLNTPTTVEAPTPTYQVLDPNPSHGHTGFDANIIMILAVLVSALICSLCINTLIKFVIKCSRMLRGGSNSYNSNMVNDPNSKVKSSGVDKRALKTFPVVKYSKEVEVQGLGSECVICLCEFKESEKVRILPKCHHGFHVKCIDKWLGSHTSCPTCRQSLVETCQKIIGCGADHHQTASSSALSSSATTVSSDEGMIVVSIGPLEREEMMRNYRGDDQVVDNQS